MTPAVYRAAGRAWPVLARAALLLAIALPATGTAAAPPMQVWQQLPVPPVPPSVVPLPPAGLYAPAPVPNQDLRAPPPRPGPGGVKVSPKLYMPADRFGGDGYMPGTTIQSEQEKRLRPGAGFNFSIPLD